MDLGRAKKITPDIEAGTFIVDREMKHFYYDTISFEKLV